MESYYDTRALEFLASTQGADMDALLREFLAFVPEGGRVLDWGCGSGRDARAMAQRGFDVVATDASPVMCREARSLTGVRVRCEAFSDLQAESEFDGIWACASLLHVPSNELPAILSLAKNALRCEGVMYCSFKRGEFEGRRGGRFFNDMTESKLATVFGEVRGLEPMRVWVTEDVRPEREGELWLNCLAFRC